MIIPSSFIRSAALSVCGFKFINIVFKEVPASEPDIPCCAKTARPVETSFNVIPAPAATTATISKDEPSSPTEVVDLLAAPTIILAASSTDKPSFEKVINALAARFAASPSPISPAAARVKEPYRPPSIICVVVRPAFESSSIARETSPTE